MDRYEVIELVKKQLSKNFNCTTKDFESYKLVVTELKNG